MSDNNTHNNIYSAEDIQNYLSGRLTPLQMNAMEKAALDDPLLAEAIEGFEGMENDHWRKPLADLKQTFAQTGNKAKVIPLKKKPNNWWKAAAAVLIIGSTATLSYFLVNKKPQREIAKNTKSDNTAIDAVTPLTSDTATAQGSIIIADTKLITEERENYKTVIKDLTREPLQQTADSSFVYKPSAANDDDALRKKAAAGSTEYAKAEEKTAAPATANAAPQQNGNYNNTINATVQENVARQQNKAEYDAFKKESKAADGIISRSEPALNRMFSAKVTSADNTPLPFANVNIKSEDFGTYADVRGNFRLLSNDSLLTVEVRAAGFKPQIITLRSNVQQNRIMLTEDNNSLADFVTTGADVKSKALRRTALIKDSAMNAEPADGWDNYNRYVDNNIDIPDDILKNNIHGQVELSFEVKANGAITNIKVDKSLCGNCDEAAIKLLQQGPQWKVKKGKKAKGKITVQF